MANFSITGLLIKHFNELLLTFIFTFLHLPKEFTIDFIIFVADF